MKKGKNGQQLAEEYLQLVQDWKSRVESQGSARAYEYARRVKRTEVARECGFSRSVCVQNEAVKSLLECCDREWYGTEPSGKAAATSAIDRAEKRFHPESSDSSRLMALVAELEAENLTLKQQLARYQALEAVVHDGMPGFRVST